MLELGQAVSYGLQGVPLEPLTSPSQLSPRPPSEHLFKRSRCAISPKHCLQHGVLTDALKNYQMYQRSQSYQAGQVILLDVQVGIGTVKATRLPKWERRPQSYRYLR